jgi:ABC-type nitrate/sulfonate/bicarbonate transport system substrate-binding protein
MIGRLSALIAALACLAQPAQAQDLKTLRYGQNAAGVGGLSSLPLNVALHRDAFRREGINLVMVPIPGGTDRIVAALDKGEIDAGKNATPYMIQAALKGSDAVAFISQTLNPVYSLIVRPEIDRFADLKGKVLGLSTPGDTITLSTVRLLNAKGIKAADYSAKAVVGTPARRANALQCRWGSRKTSRRSHRASRGLASPTRPARTSSSTSTWCGAPGASRTRTCSCASCARWHRPTRS